MTWVYVICWRQRGPCKIGVAEHPDDRLSNLQCASPYKLHIWRAYGVTSRRLAFEAEKNALWLLRAQRLQGEWVEATVNQASEAVIRSYTALGITPVVFDRQAHGLAKPPPAPRKIRLKRLRREREERAMAEYRRALD